MSARAGAYATYTSSSQGSATSAQVSLLTASSASPSAAVEEAPNVVATASLGARASNTTSPASSIALVGDIAVSSASVLAGSGSAVAVSGSATANARPVSASSLAASYARMAPVATFAATPSLLSAAASGAPPDTSFDDVSDEASGGSPADVLDTSETPGETGDSTSDPNENVENSDPETPTGPVDPDPAEPADPDPVDPFDPLEPADPDPADPVDPSEPVIPTEPETPIEKPCTYVLTFDMNGGAFSGDTYKPASPSNCTVGKDEVLINTAALTKEGHEFLCWNTDASGKGVPIRDGETLSADILRAMLIETASDGADGSTIQLYAQWNATGTQPVLIDTEVPDVSTTPNAPVVSLPSQNFSTNQTASVLGSAANRTPTVRTSSAFDAAPEAAEATDPLAEALDIIADTENALVPLPPALEVLPAAAEEFTTLSAEALAGLEDADGFLGWIASMTPAEATQAAGTALAAAGVVALLASVAGAASSSLARRRVERTGAPNANTQD